MSQPQSRSTIFPQEGRPYTPIISSMLRIDWKIESIVLAPANNKSTLKTSLSLVAPTAGHSELLKGTRKMGETIAQVKPSPKREQGDGSVLGTRRIS